MSAPRDAADKVTEKGEGNITGFTEAHCNHLTLQNALKQPLECRILGDEMQIGIIGRISKFRQLKVLFDGFSMSLLS